MTEEQIKNVMNDLHYRSFIKLYHAVKNAVPTATKQQVRRLMASHKHDRYLKRKQIKPYMIKVFAPAHDCYFMDIMDNGKDNQPRYYHVFVGVNSRYAVAYPLSSKSSHDVKLTLSKFINDYKPMKLTSDQEKAFTESSVLKLLTDNYVLLQTVPDSNHSTLGIIDRLIRTLRDMNRPRDKSNKQSHDGAYQYINPTKMNKLLHQYNNTYHMAIGCTPNDMHNNHKLEEEYIKKCFMQKAKQHSIKDFELPSNTYVRYIVSRDPMKKRRYRVTHESFKIAGKQGNHYILEAADGTTVIKPRYKLIVADPSLYNHATTIPGSNKGILTDIISYNPRTKKYDVLFDVPGQESYHDTIPASYLRGIYPQRMSTLEKQYHKAHSFSNQ